jgi:tetratricopeptide (TPR) repeat protein
MQPSGIKRPVLAVALLALLPLLLSQCSKKPAGPIRGLTAKEMARLEASHDPWGDKTAAAVNDKKGLPPDRLQALGDLALENRDFQNSLVNYLAILRTDPKRDDIRYRVGVIFLMTGQLEAAQKELAQVLLRKPDMLQAHEALGLVFLQGKKYPQAVEEFQQVLSQDSKRPKTHYLLGVTFLEAGQNEKAIRQLQKSVELDSRQTNAYVSLGQAYNQLKDYKRALPYLKKAREVAPQNDKVNYQLGLALAGLKEYPEALQAFMKAGDEAQAYNNIGVYYYMDGRYEEAAKCFQRAIEIRPTFYQEARNNLQRALEKMQQSPSGS